jgi:hypothetical protein
VYKLLSTAAFLGVLTFSAIGAAPTQANGAADPSGIHGRALGLVKPHGNPDASGAKGAGQLLYHTGGSVQTGVQQTYAIYWGTSFSSTYQTIINRYFTDVAADSGKTTDVYYSDTQYYQTLSGVTTPIPYSEQFSGSWADAADPTVSDCSNSVGGSVCVSDAAIENEVAKAITANNWPTGLGAEYFVFLGNGIGTCLSSTSCFDQGSQGFCAYHSHYVTTGGATVLYANMPYTGHVGAGCASGQSPNGDSDADSTINVTSHEANETITDPLGNAWFDRAGYENGDKCAWIFGSATGNYNQTINGDHYYLQGEYSNKSRNCVWSGT